VLFHRWLLAAILFCLSIQAQAHADQIPQCERDAKSDQWFTLDALSALPEALHTLGAPQTHAIKGCYGTAEFSQGRRYLLDLSQRKACEVNDLWLDVQDDQQKGHVQFAQKYLLEVLPLLDWGTPDCVVWAVGRKAGNVFVARIGSSEKTTWLLGENRPREIAFTLTTDFAKDANLDRIIHLLFETAGVEKLEYLGDRGAIATSSTSDARMFYSLVGRDLGPHQVCIQSGLDALRRLGLDEQFAQRLNDYESADHLYRTLVTSGLRWIDPITFAFRC
jgi:hypothetical protein